MTDLEDVVIDLDKRIKLIGQLESCKIALYREGRK